MGILGKVFDVITIPTKLLAFAIEDVTTIPINRVTKPAGDAVKAVLDLPEDTIRAVIDKEE